MSQFEAEWSLLGRELIGMNAGKLIKNTPGKIRHIYIKSRGEGFPRESQTFVS